MFPTQNIQPNQDSRITQTIHTEASSNNFKKYLLIGLGIFVLMIFWIWVNNPMFLTVTGVGSVSVPATNATVSFTLSANDGSIGGAISSVQAKAGYMENFLKSQGVAEGDIAQTQVTAVPAVLVSVGSTGFQATISMAAKTIHVSDVSNLISSLYSNGAVVVAQPVLSVENQDALTQQAYDSAMKDAKTQSDKIGMSSWKFIRKVVQVSSTSSASTSNSSTKADTLTSANNQTAATNGVFKVAQAVTVSYKMW